LKTSIAQREVFYRRKPSPALIWLKGARRERAPANGDVVDIGTRQVRDGQRRMRRAQPGTKLGAITGSLFGQCHER
jgi:hypothetical protein